MKAYLLIAVLLAASTPARAQTPRLEFSAAITVHNPSKRFGGLSGLEVLDYGTRFLAIGDRGVWVTGSLIRRDGRLVRVRDVKIGLLLTVSGRRLRNRETDSEGLTVDARGHAFVSFEGLARIREYDDITGPARIVPSDPDFANMRNNQSLETVAIDQKGTLYTIPETSGAPDIPFPVYRLKSGRWDKSLRIPRHDSFRITDADFGPDGALYVLERDFKWLGGFSTRVRRYRVTTGGLTDRTTLLRTRFSELDNMEGISVWTDAQGRTRITLISDDNFFALQKTMIAEYILVDN